MKAAMLLHIPHSSAIIPDEYAEDFTCDISEDIRKMTDWYTDELFSCHRQRIVFPISRLVCDVERFRDDALEEMATRGMGVCYVSGYDGRPIRVLSAERKDTIIRKWYDPHHEKLERLTKDILDKHGECIIVDCHSFSDTPLPCEHDQSRSRPDICIGTDFYHTPEQLTEKLCEAFIKRGYSVKINSPFAGSIVPAAYYRKDNRVSSVMIEVNRGLYLTESCGKDCFFEALKKDISSVITNLHIQ